MTRRSLWSIPPGRCWTRSPRCAFGFREFWIEGRDFYLNGTRFHSFVVPIDNAQMGAAWATYDAGARPCSATNRSG